MLRKLRSMLRPKESEADSASSPRYAHHIAVLESYCGALDGKRILEIGSATPPDLIAEIDSTYRVAEAVGINLDAEDRQLTRTLRTVPCDVRAMPFPDDHFDMLVSSAVFEHVHDFDKAMREMARVTKPGGFMNALVGPIWSCPFGHHLWIQNDDRLVNYHNVILPSFCHLLMSRGEVEDWLRQEKIDDAAAIAAFVFESPYQNRLMFSDYEDVVDHSGFEKIYFRGIEDVALMLRYDTKITADQLVRLNTMFPRDRDKFFYVGLDMLLRKPG